MDLNELVRQLPDNVRATLLKPLYAEHDHERKLFAGTPDEIDVVERAADKDPKPVLLHKDGEYRINPFFEDRFLFSAGYIVDLRFEFLSTEAKQAIDFVRDFRPLHTEDSFLALWQSGMHVVSRQDNVFHRRHVVDDNVPVEGRYLSRAQFFDDVRRDLSVNVQVDRWDHAYDGCDGSADSFSKIVLSGLAALQDIESKESFPECDVLCTERQAAKTELYGRSGLDHDITLRTKISVSTCESGFFRSNFLGSVAKINAFC